MLGDAVIRCRLAKSEFCAMIELKKSEMSAEIKYCKNEVMEECVPKNNFRFIPDVKRMRKMVHIPYFPLLHQPGWLLRYIVGPHDKRWAENVFADIWAGITVGLTLIPQVCLKSFTTTVSKL